MKRYRTVLEAIYRLYAHSGFTMAGAVAFSRQGNPEQGEFDEAEILKIFGDVPDDFHFT